MFYMTAGGFIHDCVKRHSRRKVVVCLFSCVMVSMKYFFDSEVDEHAWVTFSSGLLLKKLDKKLERTLLHSYQKVFFLV